MIPKQHVADIFEYNDVLASDVFARIPKVARALEKAFPEMEGLNILNNNKEVAYQSVFHSHVHLIPVIQKKMILYSFWQPSRGLFRRSDARNC